MVPVQKRRSILPPLETIDGWLNLDDPYPSYLIRKTGTDREGDVF